MPQKSSKFRIMVIVYLRVNLAIFKGRGGGGNIPPPPLPSAPFTRNEQDWELSFAWKPSFHFKINLLT